MEIFSVGDLVTFESPGGLKIEATIQSITPGINEADRVRYPTATITGKRISGSIEVPTMYLKASD